MGIAEECKKELELELVEMYKKGINDFSKILVKCFKEMKEKSKLDAIEFDAVIEFIDKSTFNIVEHNYTRIPDKND